MMYLQRLCEVTTRHATVSAPGFGDFFSSLMNSTSPQAGESRDYQSEEWWNSEKSDDSYNNASGNRNLSSVIERIRDEGSAEIDNKQNPMQPLNDTVVQSSSSNKKEFVEKYEAAAKKQKDLELELELDLRRGREAKISSKSKSKKPMVAADLSSDKEAGNAGSLAVRPKGVLYPFMELVMMVAVTVLVFGFYYLYSQNLQLKATLNSYEDKLEETHFSQDRTEQIQFKVDSLSEQIVGVTQTVESIRADYQEIDSKIEISIAEDYEPEIFEVSDIRDDINALQNELIKQQKEEGYLKTRVVSGIKNDVIEAGNVSKSVSAKQWMVNLASLASKARAQMWVMKLSAAGFQSSLVEKQVSGSRFYRLSVNGFATRQEAAEFILIAEKKYGFEGGWLSELR